MKWHLLFLINHYVTLQYALDFVCNIRKSWEMLFYFRDCNKRKCILSISSELYAAVYLQLYTVWKNEGKTIADSGFVLKGKICVVFQINHTFTNYIINSQNILFVHWITFIDHNRPHALLEYAVWVSKNGKVIFQIWKHMPRRIHEHWWETWTLA